MSGGVVAVSVGWRGVILQTGEQHAYSDGSDDESHEPRHHIHAILAEECHQPFGEKEADVSLLRR